MKQVAQLDGKTKTYITTLAKLALLCLGTAGILTCSKGEGAAKKIEVAIFPKQPSVHLHDITINKGTDLEEEIAGPWFSFQIQITNANEKENFFLLSISLKSVGSLKGKAVEAEVLELGPSDFTCGNVTCTTFINAFAPAAKFTPGVNIYVSGLPSAEAGAVDNQAVRIEGTLEGFFGTDETHPTTDIKKVFYFNTKFSN